MKRFTLIGIFALLTAGIIVLSRFATPQHPEQALSAVLASVRSATSVSGVANAAMLLPGAGKAAKATPFMMRAAFRFAMPTESAPGAGDIALTVFGAADDGADAFAEMRSLPDGTSYVRMDHFPLGGLTGTALDGVNGIWWQMDRAERGSLAIFGVGPTALDAKTAPAALDDAAIAARWARMRSAIADGTLFVTGGTAKTEMLAGVRTFRTTLGFRRAETAAFLTDLREALLGRALTEEEAADAVHDAEEGSAVLHVWTDARSGALLQTQLELATVGGASHSIIFQAVDLVTPVTVEAPTASKPFADLAKQLLKQ